MSSLFKILSLVLIVGFCSCGDTDPREQFIGTWEGTLSGCSIDIPFIGAFDVPDFPVSMSFSLDGNDDTMVIVSFDMNDGSATISDKTIMLAPVTTPIDAMGIPVDLTISGMGVLTSDTEIDMDLTLSVLGGTSECPITLTKI